MRSITQLIECIVLGIIMLSCGNSKNTENSKEEVVEQPKKTIHEATFFGDLGAIRNHIEFETDLNQKDEYGSTPLNVAITFGKYEIDKSIVKGGVDLTVTTADGSTPLHSTAFFGRNQIVAELIKKRVDLEVKNSYGATALETASAPFDQMKPVYIR
ncbi:MAG: ankyrin repeat domain-containing protein [Bacteroidota bacterium]